MFSSVIKDEVGNISGIVVRESYQEVSNSNTIEIDYESNLDVFIGDNYLNYYYDMNDSSVKKKLLQSTSIDKSVLSADGVDVIAINNSLSGLFIATNVLTKETISGSISGNDTFSTTISGIYSLTVYVFPYINFTATVEAL